MYKAKSFRKFYQISWDSKARSKIRTKHKLNYTSIPSAFSLAKKLNILHHHGTHEWVFRHVDTWFLDRGSDSRVLIVAGNADMGKSVIATKLCKKMKDQGRLGGMHFCQHNKIFILKKVTIHNDVTKALRNLTVGSPSHPYPKTQRRKNEEIFSQYYIFVLHLEKCKGVWSTKRQKCFPLTHRSV